MNKKISLSMAVSLMALTAAVTFILTLSFSRKQFNSQITEIDRLSEKYERLDELDALVRKEYYTEIPDDGVTDGMLNGYIQGLGDPYSTFRSASELVSYENNSTGIYSGIGITVRTSEQGEVVIVSVTENGSAQSAGLEAGDTLLYVNNISVKEHPDEALKQFAGDIGSKVNVRVRKVYTTDERDYTVTIMQLSETTVFSEMLEHHIGYISVRKFRTVTVEQFDAALHDLLSRGAKGFIFDVRNNSGGMISALESMADPLLPEGELAFSYNKAGDAETIIRSDAKSLDMPYVVLVNGGTASASELFACLLRDYAGAKLVGEKTYGKGIMQTTYALSSGGVTLTTSTYATGKTPCYHGIGLEPDVLSVPDSESETDTQLADAQKTLLGMIGDDTEKDAA